MRLHRTISLILIILCAARCGDAKAPPHGPPRVDRHELQAFAFQAAAGSHEKGSAELKEILGTAYAQTQRRPALEPDEAATIDAVVAAFAGKPVDATLAAVPDARRQAVLGAVYAIIGSTPSLVPMDQSSVVSLLDKGAGGGPLVDVSLTVPYGGLTFSPVLKLTEAVRCKSLGVRLTGASCGAAPLGVLVGSGTGPSFRALRRDGALRFSLPDDQPFELSSLRVALSQTTAAQGRCLLSVSAVVDAKGEPAGPAGRGTLPPFRLLTTIAYDGGFIPMLSVPIRPPRLAAGFRVRPTCASTKVLDAATAPAPVDPAHPGLVDELRLVVDGPAHQTCPIDVEIRGTEAAPTVLVP